MPPEVPGVRFRAGELGAIHPRLLTGADADHLAVQGIADGVRLRVLHGDETEQQVASCVLGERAAHHAAEVLRRHGATVARLRQRDPENFPRLFGRRAVSRIGFDHDETAALLSAECLERPRFIARRDHAVG